jgi:CRISP-associated protein Cas1
MLSLPDFREKGLIVCFTSEGQTISFKNDNLVVKDKNDKIILQQTCYLIFSVWIVGNITLTSGIIQRAKKYGFSIFLMSYGLKPQGVWNAGAEGNFLLREKQYQYKSPDIAWHLVRNKIENQILLLKSIRKKSIDAKTTIADLKGYHERELENPDFKTILGLEGIASKQFFKIWYGDLDWKGRKPRVKIDPMNVLLDIGYTYLFNFIEAMTLLYGFDIYRGVYHQNYYQRKSLVCDLVEPFRCIIDKKIKNAYGLGQVDEKDFNVYKGAYSLRIDKNKKYTALLVQDILKHKEDIFLYVQDYYRAFMRNKPIEEFPVFRIKEEPDAADLI